MNPVDEDSPALSIQRDAGRMANALTTRPRAKAPHRMQIPTKSPSLNSAKWTMCPRTWEMAPSNCTWRQPDVSAGAIAPRFDLLQVAHYHLDPIQR